MCVSMGRERVSISNWHFLVVVPQPLGFCVLKKWASHSVWFVFPQYMSFPGETFPGKMQLPFFSLFAAVKPKQKADENRALGCQSKGSKTLTTDLTGILDKYMYCEIFTCGTS